MSRRTRWVLGAIVALAHGLVLLLVARERVLPSRPYVPPPNFGYVEGEVVDEETGTRVVIKQFTVSTKLADDGRAVAAAGHTNEQDHEPISAKHPK